MGWGGVHPILHLTGTRSILQSVMVPACTLELKIIPNAPRNEIAGWLGPALKVKVHAPALEGRANDELLAFLAETLGVPRRSVTLLRGDKSRQKVVRIEGLDAAALQARLRS
jgi:uncharacterized protein (TIGR00251 family)